MHAYRAIEAGDVDTVAIVYGNNQLSARAARSAPAAVVAAGAAMMPCPMRYEFPTGLTLVGAYAMAAQRHMHQYGTTPEQLASISVQTREHAGRNPNAMYRDPITVDDVLSSKLVADPLHKLDCCVISDGGCCIILTTEERARDLAHRPVLRARRGGRHDAPLDPGDGRHDHDRGRGQRAEGVRGGRHHAGRRRHVPMYDSFTYTVLVVLEDLGFAPKGEGGAFVADGNLRLGGALPTNTDGGGLSSTHPGHARPLPPVRGDAAAPRRGRRQPGRRARRSRCATAAAAGCRRRAPSCSERSRCDDRRASGRADWTETPKYLVPRPNEEDGEFWEGARRGELRIQHCTTLRAAPALRRASSASTAAQTTLEWVTASGLGTVYSFTVIRQNGVPPFNERVPFVVAAVDLDEAGARVLAAMPTLAPEAARVGMRVRASLPARERRARLRRLRRRMSEPDAGREPAVAIDGRAARPAGRADAAGGCSTRPRRCSRRTASAICASSTSPARVEHVARDLLPVLPRRRGRGARARGRGRRVDRAAARRARRPVGRRRRRSTRRARSSRASSTSGTCNRAVLRTRNLAAQEGDRRFRDVRNRALEPFTEALAAQVARRAAGRARRARDVAGGRGRRARRAARAHGRVPPRPRAARHRPRRARGDDGPDHPPDRRRATESGHGTGR